MNLFRTPAFWLIFTISGLGAAYASYYLFPQAFPIVHLDLRMDRAQANAQAIAIAQQYALGPQDACEATIFHTDEHVKTFVELEAGGKEAFVAMMEKNLYQPYSWQVRRFKQFDPHQVIIAFTPTGKPYACIETLAEDDTGTANLSEKDALRSAIRHATSDPWNIDLDQYKLIESSQEQKTSGRIDHIFVYERTDETIGEGQYRLRLRMSGSTFTELTQFVNVPEAFTQRYNHMRSANETIAYTAKLVLLLVYILGGCLIGLFVLQRNGWIVWRAPLIAAILVSAMTTLQHLNELPTIWMQYNTAFSTNSFLTSQIVGMCIEFVYWVFILFISFTAAESLTRKAFGTQIQLWRIWSSPIASSLPVLGQTIGGYLIVPFMLLFVVLFYIVTTTYYGWWTPSNALFNPNILASYVPWWQSIAISLRAGFWEECLFRAVPLAAAALLGDRYGKRTWWIAGACILQAVVFGAAHANYPAQPAYARLLELLTISSIFGGIYLRFGLLPAIIAHYTYDVMWFSLPLFISHAPHAVGNMYTVVALALVPLWIVVWSRYRSGAWNVLARTAYNSSWKPSYIKPRVQKAAALIPISITPRLLYTSMLIGIASIGLWLGTTRFKSDAPPFTVNRSQAVEQAHHIMESKKVDLSAWYTMAAPRTHFADMTTPQRFIWQEGSHELYHALLGTYLTPPYWLIRYAQFEGTVQERAEQHLVYLKPDGSLYRYTHIVPEESAGDSLSVQDARAIAYAALFKYYTKQGNDVTEISAIEQKKPHRLDWIFTFSCPQDYPLNQGQARIQITISGNQVTDVVRYIHVPEPWERDQEHKKLIASNIRQFCSLMLYVLIIAALLYAFMYSETALSYAGLASLTAAIGAIFMYELINSWPWVVSSFTTSQPFADQLFRSFAIQGVSLCMRAAFISILILFSLQWRSLFSVSMSPIYRYILGATIGSASAASISCIQWLIPSIEPLWPNYNSLRFALPLSAGINSYILTYLPITALLLLIAISLQTVTKNMLCIAPILLVCTLIGGGVSFAESIPLMLSISGALWVIFTASYYAIIRYTIAVIPPAVATYFILHALQQASFDAQPHAWILYGGACIIMMILSWIWSTHLD